MKPARRWGIAMQGCEPYFVETIVQTYLEMKKTEPFRYIEIGIAEGYTAAAVAETLRLITNHWKIFAVDISGGWSFNWELFKENIEQYGSQISWSLDGSPRALRAYVPKANLIFIDGNHSRESVITDFEEAHKILAVNGRLIFHDSDAQSQGKDTEHLPKGIEVRKTLEELGLLFDQHPKYMRFLDFPGNGNGRGMFITKKLED